MIKSFFRKLNRYVPKVSICIYFLTLIAVILHVFFIKNTAFSDFFNKNISSIIRAVLAKATNILPFSLAEAILIFLPVIAVTLIIVCNREAKNNRRAIRCSSALLSAVAMIYVIFVFTFAPAYRCTPIDKKAGVERYDLSPEQIYEATEIVINEISMLTDEIHYLNDSSSFMPYNINELSEKLMDSYDEICREYSFVQKINTRVKPIILSGPMTYTHISGVYSFFTGEANINTNYPDYIIVYSAAHELAHQRGIARENEANFVAFLVCINSEDPYIRYSGYMNIYSYMESALYQASPELYNELSGGLPNTARGERKAYSKFFDKYRDNIAASVTNTVNDKYLSSQGNVGSKSYGMVVDLAVSYLISGQ